MRTLLLMSLLATAPVFAQAPAPPPAPAPGAPGAPKQAPAQPAPRRRAPAPAARSGIAMVVTDTSGATLADVHVELSGAATAKGDTDAGGQVNFPGLQPGTYRLRFTGDSITAFEREVTLRAGAIERLEIKLTAAQPAKAPAAAAAPPPPKAGPVGAPQLGSLTNLADRERNTKEPRREILLSCSGNTRNVLVMLTELQPERIYDSAEATYYVISGQGSATVGTLQSTIGSGTFFAVPRGTRFSISRQGNRPLVMLWTLSGEPCEQAR